MSDLGRTRLGAIVEAQGQCTLITFGLEGYARARTVTRLNRIGQPDARIPTT